MFDPHQKSFENSRPWIYIKSLHQPSSRISVFNTPYWFKLAPSLAAALVLGLIDLWENKYLFAQSAVFSIVSWPPAEQV